MAAPMTFVTGARPHIVTILPRQSDIRLMRIKTGFRRIQYISSELETAERKSARNDQQECGMQGSKGKERDIGRFIGDACGASPIEYALIGALVSVVVIITLLAVLGPKT
jgi:hypothetical protein